MSPARLILGVDPGSQATGWGIVSVEGSRQRYVASGVIRPGTGDFNERLRLLHDELTHVIAAYNPQEAAVESLFFAKNAQSALKLGHVRGVLILACLKAGLEVAEYSPREIKLALVGKGAAEKFQVAKMVALMLGLSKAPPADAADALAAALTHAAGGPLGGGGRQRGGRRKRGLAVPRRGR